MAEGKEKKSAPVWDVDATPVDEIDIKINYMFRGETVEIHHYLREPTALDKKARENYLAVTKIDPRNKKAVKTDYVGANIVLWEKCIKRVTGYSVDETSPNWMNKIPREHKSDVIERLFQWTGMELDEEEAKNLNTVSAQP